MDRGCRAGDGTNFFALVGYLPEALSSFVGSLRAELVPGCQTKPHITLLPPRSLTCSVEEAWTCLRELVEGRPSFSIQLGEVQLFPVSDVIYISLSAGFQDLQRFHERLNRHCLEFKEPWQYQPHITLAQELEHDEVGAKLALASQRWHDFAGPRAFTLERVTFVRLTEQGRWADLESCDLNPAVPA